jgi:CHAD domain-containing protein
MARMRVLEDDLRWFRDAAGDIRDLDVLLAEEQPEAFARFLRSRRGPARKKLLQALEAPRTAGLVTALELLPTLPAKEARRRLPGLARRVVRAAGVLAQDVPSVEEMHALRKRVRVLRYALEFLGEKSEEVEELQDHLGWLGDLRAATTWHDAWPDADDHQKYRQEIANCITAGIAESKVAWEAVRKRVKKLS